MVPDTFPSCKLIAGKFFSLLRKTTIYCCSAALNYLIMPGGGAGRDVAKTLLEFPAATDL